MFENVIHIEGLEDAHGMLARDVRRAMPEALEAGLEAGAGVIEDTLAPRIPQKEGGLAEDLATDIEIAESGEGGVAHSGFGEQGYKAGFVEYGHQMIGHRPLKKEEGAVIAHPFMRPAAEAASEPAVEAFADGFCDALSKKGIVDAA